MVPGNGKKNVRMERLLLAFRSNPEKRWMKQPKGSLGTHHSEKKIVIHKTREVIRKTHGNALMTGMGTLLLWEYCPW